MGMTSDTDMTGELDITGKQREMLHALLRQYIPGVAVWAYGSRVKGTARVYSDLDVVAFAVPEESASVSELKEALAESNLPFLVDVHVWDEIPEGFRKIVREKHVILQNSVSPERLGVQG